MQRPTEWFRMPFWLVFVFGCAWAMLIVAAFYVPQILSGSMVFDVRAFFAGLVAGEVTAVVFYLPLVFYFQTGIGPEGIRGFNFWGVYRDAPWEDFRSVSPFNLLGLRFLRAHTARGWSPLWLPIFLNDWDRFRDRVLEYAGPEHPLSRALEDEVG
jgi:hypothetical protein